ncbi:MAG: AbrB/MazE/SpoVT family DNA-binding domain-containing protein [Cyanobacteria bacterium RM1_2_2]|nr:AbrB/MazE/SpoVT family DNA-binding domain-containing protein [Cyanobacteria bacterium RM1_2_2]
MEKIQILKQGDDQVVVLPREFQVQGDEVYIKKIGSTIVLFSQDHPWQLLFDSLNQFSDDFMETREQPPLETREALE